MTPEVTAEHIGIPLDPDGWLIDGSVVMWWGWKDMARAGAKAIGWPYVSIVRVHTRFQNGYALKQMHGGLLTRRAYAQSLDSSQAMT